MKDNTKNTKKRGSLSQTEEREERAKAQKYSDAQLKAEYAAYTADAEDGWAYVFGLHKKGKTSDKVLDELTGECVRCAEIAGLLFDEIRRRKEVKREEACKEAEKKFLIKRLVTLAEENG
jgi:hypothetical protein